jgi:predicted lipoprotein with Yx(FWY)xxD motif
VKTSGRAFKPTIFRRLACVAAVSIVGLAGVATALASSTTEVKLIKDKGGKIVGQQKGFALYIYCTFGSNGEVCKKGHTSKKWPPMIAYHTPVAGPGINKKKLGTKTINGKKIVTYYGQPLYRYSGDKKPGQVRGEGKAQGAGQWWKVSAFGQPLVKNQY